MARTTTNYGFNISEGTDLVNPLTDIFPNFESLDTDLKDVSNATFGVATELKSGTVHALTRDDHDKDVFKFTATSNFTAGDTFTIDGEQVSALTTSGEQLSTGCYVIGSEVIVAKKGTLLTFFISNVVTDATTLEGHSASYFATASDLSDTDADVLAVSNKVGSAVLTTTAQDCSGAINELNTDLSNLSDKGTYVQLVQNSGATGNITVPDLSQFSEIFIGMNDSASPHRLHETTRMSMDLFKTFGYWTRVVTSGNGDTQFNYVDNTTIKVAKGGSGTQYPYTIYGIK